MNDANVEFTESVSYGLPVTHVTIKTTEAAWQMNRPAGHYTTIRTGPLYHCGQLENICRCLAEQLRLYLAPYVGKALCICGLGNSSVPADSLGPETVKRIGLDVCGALPVRSVFSKIAALSPRVSGTADISMAAAVSGAAAAVDAACMLAIDATQCSDYDNLCRCIQLNDTGLEIHRNGERLCRDTAGMPVVALGVPSLIHANHLAAGSSGAADEFLTVSSIVSVVKNAASVIACAVLLAAYPELDYNTGKMIASDAVL